MHFLNPQSHLWTWTSWDSSPRSGVHRIARCHRGRSVTERLFLVPNPPSPPAHADTNQAQQPEWNTNVECLCRAALASASSPGISVPRKPQRSQDSINHATPPRASQALRVGFGRKTHARFQCLLVKLGSYSSAVGRIKTPKGILFDQGGFKSKEK